MSQIIRIFLTFQIPFKIRDKFSHIVTIQILLIHSLKKKKVFETDYNLRRNPLQNSNDDVIKFKALT